MAVSKKKKEKGINRKKELIWSTLLTLVIFFGAIYSTVPFNYVMDYGEYLTESWEEESKEPPVPHAEKLSIVELAAQLDSISVQQIVDRMKNSGIKFDNTEQILIDIRKLNNKPPLEIYEAIVKNPSSQKDGTGIGRLTLEEFSNKYNKDLKKFLSF